MDLALPIAIVVVAALAWDVARRHIANQASELSKRLTDIDAGLQAHIALAELTTTNLRRDVDALQAAVSDARAAAHDVRERNDAQVKNLLTEVHDLLKQHDTKQAGVIAATSGRSRQRLRMGAG